MGVIRVPGYPDVQLTEAGAALLRRVHDYDQGYLHDDGRRDRVYATSPSTGQAAARLVRQGLLRYATRHRAPTPAGPADWIDGVECTAAGCVVLAALERR